MSTPSRSSDSIDIVQRLAECITTVDPFVVLVNPVVVVPPGVAAADGVGIRVALAVCHEAAVSQRRIQQRPELVVELHGRSRPRLHDHAWRWLRVPDVWLMEPGRSMISASSDVGEGMRSTEEIGIDRTVVRETWSCHITPKLLLG